ncbi:MAG: transaldolase family protein, partial [Synechococcales bacterium]|nr:transaldolase family protein [Synechococcales bacterium]
ILDWFKKESGRDDIPPEEDPGVHSVTRIYNYFRKFGYKTEIMGASFRNIGEIRELAGCDLLTISPNLLKVLDETEGDLPRKLDPSKAESMDIEKISMDKDTFDKMHAADRMSNEKLDEGIQGFSKAILTLETLLRDRLARLEGAQTLSNAAHDVFIVYDLDGDGFITREEWMGTDIVFDALDKDHDGKISPEEMALGLGAAVQMS